MGVKQLLKGALRWRFSPIWYLFAIFIVALLRFANIGLHIKAIPIPSQWMNFGLIFIIGQLWVVIGEEYGWRGEELILDDSDSNRCRDKMSPWFKY